MNILFVDDRSNVLSSVLTSIDWRGNGFSSVFSASSAMKAKEIIKEHLPIDILVTDVEMPGEDEVLSLITRFGKINTIWSVLCSPLMQIFSMPNRPFLCRSPDMCFNQLDLRIS